jgi:hypothetical protein
LFPPLKGEIGYVSRYVARENARLELSTEPRQQTPAEGMVAEPEERSGVSENSAPVKPWLVQAVWRCG